MNITIRLYRTHDPDLISLYKNPAFSFEDVLIHILNGYVEKKPIYFYVPTVFPMDMSVIPHSIMIHLHLDEEQHTKIINFINTLKKGYRNSFFKNILRSSLITINYYPYIDIDSDKDQITEINTFIKKNITEYKKVYISPPKRKRGKKKKENPNINSTSVLKIANVDNVHNSDIDVIAQSKKVKNKKGDEKNNKENIVKDKIIKEYNKTETFKPNDLFNENITVVNTNNSSTQIFKDTLNSNNDHNNYSDNKINDELNDELFDQLMNL